MNRNDAKIFLEYHQPLPDVLDKELHDKLLSVWEFYRHNPDATAIPLMLNIFGDGDAGGIYQRFEDLLAMYPPEVIVPHLIRQLESAHRPARYWCAQFAASFPDERLVEPLARLFQEDDTDLHAAAATALGQVHSHRARQALEEALLKETDPETRQIISDILQPLY